MLYTSPWSRFELTWIYNYIYLCNVQWVPITTDKYNYHTITAKKTPYMNEFIIFCLEINYWYSENEIPSDKSGKMTAGLIKTLEFQDRLSSIALSFDFANFVNKKELRDLPSRPCLVSGHVREVLLFHWPFKGILSDSIFFDIRFRLSRLICQFPA
jgi:hypothetical protein